MGRGEPMKKLALILILLIAVQGYATVDDNDLDPCLVSHFKLNDIGDSNVVLNDEAVATGLTYATWIYDNGVTDKHFGLTLKEPAYIGTAGHVYTAKVVLSTSFGIPQVHVHGTLLEINAKASDANATAPQLKAIWDANAAAFAIADFNCYNPVATSTWTIAKAESAFSGGTDTTSPPHGVYYGRVIRLPTGFPVTLDSNLIELQGSTGSIPNIKIDSFITSLASTKTFYVNAASGSDSANGLTAGTAFATVYKAIDSVQADSNTSFTIKLITGGVDVLYGRSAAGNVNFSMPKDADGNTINGKTLLITPDDTNHVVYATTAQMGRTWTLHDGSTYYTIRQSTGGVVDMNDKDDYGLPKGYVKKANVAEVNALAGSWFTGKTRFNLDGNTVYVHTLLGVEPHSDTTQLVEVYATQLKLFLRNSATLVLRNIYFAGADTLTAYNYTADLTNNRLISYNCRYANNAPYLTNGGNGFTVDGIKQVYDMCSVSAYNRLDGFNYHVSSTRIGAAEPNKYLMVSAYSQSFNQGEINTSNINNAFTSHDGASTVRIKCTGYHTDGPVFADTIGCQIAMYDCNSADSMLTSSTSNACYQFAGVGGKAYLDNCDSNEDANGYDIVIADSQPVTILNFNAKTSEKFSGTPSVITMLSPSVAGQVGTAYNFNGVDDYINIGQTLNSTLQDSSSVILWARILGRVFTAEDLFGVQSTTETDSFCWAALNKKIETQTYQLDFAYRAGGNEKTVSYDLGLPFGVDTGWVQYGFVLTKSSVTGNLSLIEIYVNGIRVVYQRIAASYPVMTSFNSDLNLHIGHIATDAGIVNPLYGQIDNVKFFRKALSADEMHQLFNGTHLTKKSRNIRLVGGTGTRLLRK